MFLQRHPDVCGKQVPHCGGGQLTHVEFLGKLVEDWTIRVLIFFYHRSDQSYQLVPELKILQHRSNSFILGFLPILRGLGLELSVVQFIAVAEEESVGGP